MVTVAELINYLERLPTETPVVLSPDHFTAEGDVVILEDIMQDFDDTSE